ncbi:hypothetical protein VTN49DRAFT_5200 [Thermomyces lanuginosus]|uniref:uncharacterized protein n=1 Tax=Thermomyces lanuginosus TaxID=5541 RepID=UPI00374271B6
MEARSQYTTTHPSASRTQVSSRQTLTELSSVPQVPPTFSHSILPQVRLRQGDSTLDESTLARRAAALRQLNGNPKPLSRRPREHKSAGGRSSSALASQPVLVRARSPDVANERRESGAMSSASTPQQRAPEMPSVQEFTIEAILRAIEPDIRSTLDSIAEICGRSRLTLSNEYGSHIAPFGEIRIPPGGLGTVDETQAGSEGFGEDSGANADDDASVGESRDAFGGTSYGLIEALRQTALATGYPQDPYGPRYDVSIFAPLQSPKVAAGKTPVAREFSAVPKPTSMALLGASSDDAADGKASERATPAMLSEFHLEARASNSLWPPISPFPPGEPIPDQAVSGRPTLDTDTQWLLGNISGWLGWLKSVVRHHGHQEKSTSPLQQQSAAASLRAVLNRYPSHFLADQQSVVVTGG